ncbi:MAG: 5-formyltetrahydrofolate cyclo-ligase, partial [Oscillospiraceae bacterium]
MTTAEEKKLLRRKLRQQARSLSAGEKAISDGKIINRLLTLPAYHRAGTVFCFVSTPWEIDTRPLLDDVLATGRRLCVPRALAGGHMELAVIRSMDDLTPGAYDILEPRAGCTLLTAGEVDFAVIPCLSCDRGGHRLG